jgi:hypothetical protein
MIALREWYVYPRGPHWSRKHMNINNHATAEANAVLLVQVLLVPAAS